MPSQSCVFCGVVCKNSTKLRDHYKTDHKAQRPFDCKVCQKKFSHASSMKRHQCSDDQPTEPAMDSQSNILLTNSAELAVPKSKELLQADQSMDNAKVAGLMGQNDDHPEPIRMVHDDSPHFQQPTDDHSQSRTGQLDCTGPVRQDQAPVYHSPITAQDQLTEIEELDQRIQQDSPSQKRKLFNNPSDYRTVYFGKIDGFNDWMSAYRRLTEDTPDTPMAESVQKQIWQYTENILLNQHTVLFENVESVVVFGEKLDEFIDAQVTSVRLGTVVQRLRYIRWYFCYILSTNSSANLEILHELDDTIGSMQTSSTVHTTNSSLLNIMDPYRLAQLANRIVAILNQVKKETIDPFLLRYFQCEGRIPTEEMVAFGLDYMRVFLELSIRMTNVPCRIECTKYLVIDTYPNEDFVAKLVIGRRHVSRLVNQDKTGKYAQLTSVPLDAALSGYLTFYTRFCRPDPASFVVFQAKNGGVWRTVSRDLKDFLTQHSVDCAEICPNGRLIHGTRNIGLAVYAILAGFDIDKIRNFATLMRHQLIHVEHIYSPWLKLQQNKTAIQDLIQLRNWTYNPVTDKAGGFEVAGLTPTGRELESALLRLLDSTFSGASQLPEYGFKDAATQTTDLVMEDNSPVELDQSPSDLWPSCDQCQGKYAVFGPYGLSRSKHFGQFYRQCMSCHGSTPGLVSQWYKLGVVPTLHTQSTKPRNISSIAAYIFEKTGVAYKLLE